MALVPRPTPTDVVQLLEVGADVVISSDADPDEVVARIIAIARRSTGIGPRGVRHLSANGLVIDLSARTCSVDGRPISLSPIEYRLLVLLMSHPQRALAVPDIVRSVWGWSHADGRNSLRIRVNRLRGKLGDPATDPRFIGAVRGVGYRFLGPVSQSGSGVGDASGPVSVGAIVDAVSTLATGLLGQPDVAAATQALVTLIDGARVADGVALFRASDTALDLVAGTGMSASWHAAVASGVPLTGAYASAHNVMAGEAVQLVDLQTDRRFPGSAEIALQEGFRAVLLVPVLSFGRVWGQVGLARHDAEPFDAATAAYVACAAALLGHLLEALE